MSERADLTRPPLPHPYSSAPSANDQQPTVKQSFVQDTGSPQARRPSKCSTPADHTGDKIGKPTMVRKRQRLANPIGQYIINVMLQMFAIAAAVVFGYFAVQSVRISDRAYKEAYLANQIAIYAVCNANDYITIRLPDFCSHVNGVAGKVFTTAATAHFTAKPDSTSGTPASSTSLAFPPSVLTSTGYSAPASSTGLAFPPSVLTSIGSSAPASTSAKPDSTVPAVSESGILFGPSGIITGGGFSLPAFTSTTVTKSYFPAEESSSPAITPASMPSATPMPSSSKNKSEVLAISIAIPIGVVLILAPISAFLFLRRRTRRKAEPTVPNGTVRIRAQHPVRLDSSSACDCASNEKRPETEGRLKRWWKSYRELFVDSTITTEQ